MVTFLVVLLMVYTFRNLLGLLESAIIVGVPAIRKMVIGGQRVAKLSFIPSGKGLHWKLENQCLVNFKSCKSVEINGCVTQHMTF